MSTVAVAKKEFNDAIRSKVLIGVTGLLVVFAAGTAFLYAEFLVQEVPGELNTLGLITTLTDGFPPLSILGLSPVHVLLPFIGLALGYRSVVSERESGRIKLLLSLPHSRADVVVGKLLGRTGVGVVATVVGFVVAAVVGVAMYQSFALPEFLGFTIAVILFVLTYVSIGIAISAAAPSTPWAIAGMGGYLAVFHAFWGGIFWFVRTFFLRPDGAGQNWTPPDWFIFFREVNPARAFNHVWQVMVYDLAGAQGQQAAQGAAEPFFLQDWFFFPVMAFWIVGPLVLGYVLFENTDL